MAVQAHCHISDTLGGSPEFSPDRTWRVNDWQPTPQIFSTFGRALNGTAKLRVLKTSAGVIKRAKNYDLVLKLLTNVTYTALQQYDYLINLMGKAVYFVDNDHVADGVSHTSYVKSMLLLGVSSPDVLKPDLNYFTVEVHLEDNTL